MGSYSFRLGTQIKVRGTNYEIVNKLADGRLQLRQPDTSELVNLASDEAQSLYAGGELEFVLRGIAPDNESLQGHLTGHVEKHFSLLPKERQDAACRRLRYVKAVFAASLSAFTPATLKPVIEECAAKKGNEDPKPPSWISVYRWVRRYLKQGKDIRALVEQFDKRGNHKARVDSRVRILTIQALEEVYLQEERASIDDTRACLIVLIDKENARHPPSQRLQIPSLKYLRRVLTAEYDAYTIEVRRYGKLAADRKFRIVLGNKERVTRPLQRVELDHTVLDLMVVDEKKLVLLGRPVIVVAIDSHTRCLVGFAIGYQQPSAVTVSQCLKHAILPKNYLRSAYPEINNAWDCMGVMETLVLDRALENLGRRVESSCLQLGADIEYCARKTPWGKGIVERVIRTLMEDLIHVMPGTTFSNVLERGDYRPDKHAVVPLSSLRAALHKWIVDVYHQTVHRGIQDTPAHKWKVDIAAHPVYLPRSVRELEVALGEPERRVLWQYGIEINSLRYNAPWLGELRRQRGNEQKMELMWYAEDLGRIDVFDPVTKQYLAVPCVDPEYASGLSLYQHEINRAHASRTMQGRQDIVALAHAKEEIRQSIAQSLGRRRGTTKKRMARYAEGRGFDYPQTLPERSFAASGQSSPPVLPDPAEAGHGARSRRRKPRTHPPEPRDDEEENDIPEYVVEAPTRRQHQLNPQSDGKEG